MSLRRLYNKNITIASIKALLFAALSTCLTAACHNSKNTFQSHNPESSILSSNEAPDELSKLLVTTNMSIDASAAAAPASVGQFIYAEEKTIEDGSNKYFTGMCSATLVAPRVILTNSHCIREEMKSIPGFCERNVFIRLKGNREKLARCVRVLHDSNIRKHGTKVVAAEDYALIEIDQDFGITPSPISTEGVQDNETYLNYSVNPTEFLKGMMIERKITVRMNTFILPNGNHNLASNHHVHTSTAVILGNSGGALFNKKGEVVGVVQSLVTDTTATEPNIQQTFPVHHLQATITVMACVNLQKVGLQTPAECHAKKSQTYLDRIKELAAEARTFQLAKKYAQENPNLFSQDLGYNVSSVKIANNKAREVYNFNVQIKPYCLRKTAFENFEKLESKMIQGLSFQQSIQLQINEFLQTTVLEEVSPAVIENHSFEKRVEGSMVSFHIRDSSNTSHMLPSCPEEFMDGPLLNMSEFRQASSQQ